jgi:hypothetical protein
MPLALVADDALNYYRDMDNHGTSWPTVPFLKARFFKGAFQMLEVSKFGIPSANW